jgi:hypothetical protein
MTRISPEGPFENTKPGSNHLPDFPQTAPDAALIASSQKVYLRTQESGQFVNIDYDGWAVFQSSQGTQFVLVQYGGPNYIVVASGRWKDYYLSYNDRSYVGAYSGWSSARYWEIDPVDCTPYPGLYPYNSYMCCNGVKDAIDKLVTVVSY